MHINGIHDSNHLRMDDESFQRISHYVGAEYGIRLPPIKKTMLESRLNKKVRSLGMNSYREFLDFVFSDNGRQGELFNVIDLITTNKTDFFREPTHFHYLSNVFLPDTFSHHAHRHLHVWSAGCSTGEEPYTLVMVLEEFKKKYPGFSYSLMASDISTRVLQTAHNGVYPAERIDNIPLSLKQAYFLRSKNSERKLVRVKPDYRKKIEYRRINLVEGTSRLIENDADIIFCRNVLIYFDKPTQERVINQLSRCLRRGGRLFLGHSESLMGMSLAFRQVQPTIYEKL